MVDLSLETCQFSDVSAAVIPSPGTLKTFCKAHAIVRLRLFGSAARGDFDPATRDPLDTLRQMREFALEANQPLREVVGNFWTKI